MISIPSLCHLVQGSFIVEVMGLGAVCFLNIDSVSLERVVRKIFRKFKKAYRGKELVIEFIRFDAGQGMPRYNIKFRSC